MKKILIILAILVFAIATGLLVRHKFPIIKNTVKSLEIIDATGGNIPGQTQVKRIFTGTIKKLDQKLGLFNITQNDKANGIKEENTNYFEAGEFIEGKYKGYKRIIAIRAEFPYKEDTIPFIFATRDYKKYIFDESLGGKRIAMLNLDKVTKKDVFDTELIENIPVNDAFSLIRESRVMYSGVIVVVPDPDPKPSPSGQQMNQSIILKTDFDEKERLASDYKNLRFYTESADSRIENETANETPFQQLRRNVQEKYLTRRDEIIVVDSTGLASRYYLTLNNEMPGFIRNSSIFDYTGLKFSKNQTDIKTPIFKTYGSYSNGCDYRTNSTYIANLKDSEVTQIGEITSSHTGIFNIINTSDSVFKYLYDMRFTYGSEDFFQFKNEGLSVPTFEEYTGKHPMLFLKDPWGKYLLLLENDYSYTVPCA